MSHLDRRQALKLLAALGGAGLVAACGRDGGDDAAAPPPATIGVLVPESGAFAAIGTELVNGFRLYLKGHGDMLGERPVQLVVVDEGNDAATATAAVTSLAEQGVLAMTGVANSAVMPHIRDAVEKAKIPLIGANASPTDIQGVIYVWRTSCVDNEPGMALGQYVARKVEGTVATIAFDDSLGRDAVDGFTAAFGARPEDAQRLRGASIVVPAKPRPGPTYFRKYLSTLRDLKPAAVFCAFHGAAAVEFVRQYRAAGITADLYAPGYLTEGKALAELGRLAERIYTSTNYAPELDNSTNLRFTADYRKTYGSTPTTYAMASYDAAAVLDKAIGLAGADANAQRVNLMLGKVGQIDSPRGTWQFNQPRTPQQKWYLRQVRSDGPVLSNVLLTELVTLG